MKQAENNPSPDSGGTKIDQQLVQISIQILKMSQLKNKTKQKKHKFIYTSKKSYN